MDAWKLEKDRLATLSKILQRFTGELVSEVELQVIGIQIARFVLCQEQQKKLDKSSNMELY